MGIEMLISIDWIKEFVDLPELSAQEMASKFTLATAEVEEVLLQGDHFEKMRVAEITSIERHPDANKLNLVTFKLSEKETKRVVCGAENVQIGLKVPYAPLGITLPNGIKLEAKKIRGILSEGMLCSEEELGYAQESSGLMELADNAVVGMNLLEHFSESKDILLDIDNKSLTHRPDLWGHYGMAREFSAIFERPLRDLFGQSWNKKISGNIPGGNSPIKVSMQKDCAGLAYYGLSLTGIIVSESPAWLKQRLLAVGLRPINNIVDISNYVMLELGIPLHIFAREKISGNINVRKIEKEEKFITLDEMERTLIPGDTIVADDRGALVLAGIMGGLNSGVDEQTKDIFIEVANWKATSVRRTSTRLGLRTDSSQRYEKTLDSQLLERTLLRTLELVLLLCPTAKAVGAVEYAGEDLTRIEPLIVKTSVDKINHVLGHEVSQEKILTIFNHLDFLVEEAGELLAVKVPSYRATKDIENEADLIEEIGRIVGYDNILPRAPLQAVHPVRLTPAQILQRKINDFLVCHTRAFEVMTNPMIGESLLKKCQWNGSRGHHLVNSLSEDQDRMRTSLVPSFLKIIALNQKNYAEFNLFELGRVYTENEKSFSQDETHLAIAMFNKEKNCFLDLVNHMERLTHFANIPATIVPPNEKFKDTILPENWSGIHPFEKYHIKIMGKIAGVLFTVHPLLLKKLKIKGNLSLGIINFSSIENRTLKKSIKYGPLPKFPSSTFDCTVVVDRDVEVAPIIACTKKLKLNELIKCELLDIFKISDRQKAVTLKSTFFHPEKTLDREFLTQAQTKLIQVLEKSGYPLKGQ